MFHPSYWVMNYSYSRTLDKFFLSGISEGELFTEISRYHAEFKGQKIWISNHPYSSFTIDAMEIRPSVTTINKLEQLLTKSALNKSNI